jgi:cytoskeleton protein RodZ
MQSVGTRLREAREKRGYSLDEINARTRINSRNLIAIEHDEVGDISSPFFYRSFVRQYAEEVGLDFRVIAPAVEHFAGNMRQPDLPGQGEHEPVRVAPIKPRLKRDFSWVVPAAVFVGLIVLGSGGYSAWKRYGSLAAIQTLSVSSLVHGQRAEAKRAAVAERSPLNTSAPAEVADPAPPPISDRIHLELAAIEPTWLTVTADGKPAYTGILEPAEVKVLEGEQSAKLKTGNAGGVNITFNGKAIGSIGPRGKTRTVIFTKTGYEVQPSDNIKLSAASHIGG